MTAIAVDEPRTWMPPKTSREPEVIGLSQVKFGKEIRGSLCAVYVTVKRPSGTVQIDGAAVSAPDEDGNMQTVESKYITGKSVHYDFNMLWEALDANGRLVKRLITRTTAQNLQRGTYMMSMLAVGEFILQLGQLQEDRKELVLQLREAWPDILQEIRSEFPDHYHLFIEKVPEPSPDRFGIEYEIYPMGTLSPDDLDLTRLTPGERQRVIDDTKEAADKLFETRLQSVFDGVFGAIVEICQDIEHGGFETGKRRDGAITNIMDVLTRAKNFAQFADPQTMLAIESAYKVVDGLSIQEINSNMGGIRERLRTTFSGVRSQVEKLREGYKAGSSRGGRSVEL